jgi:hypothetical protein
MGQYYQLHGLDNSSRAAAYFNEVLHNPYASESLKRHAEKFLSPIKDEMRARRGLFSRLSGAEIDTQTQSKASKQQSRVPLADRRNNSH